MVVRTIDTTQILSDGSEYPFGFVLCFINLMDTILGKNSEWRAYVPFGWADPGHALSWKSENVTDFFPTLLTFSDFVQTQPESASTMTNLYNYAFETSSTELGNVLSPTATLVLLFLVFTLRRVKATVLPFFSSLGRKAGRHTHGVEWERNNEERIVKFGEYVFRLIYHSVISLIGIVYFWNSEWWNIFGGGGDGDSADSAGGTKSLWIEFPHDEILPGMAWYYLLQCAYNVDAFFSLLELSLDLKVEKSTSTTTRPSLIQKIFPYSIQLSWSPTCRGDFTEMFIHHVVTNLLVIGSSFFRLTRVGSMVFMVHDISDVPVDLSKLANFLKWKTTTIVCFVTMVLVWLVTRLLIFPFVIYKSILYESYLVMHGDDGIGAIFYYTYYWYFVTLVALIILLHVAWFGMFLQMGYILITKREAHDLSEHKQGEPDAFTHKNGKTNHGTTLSSSTSTNGTAATTGATSTSTTRTNTTNGHSHSNTKKQN
mmetsp:Transcript_5983/g.8461  ORF Transcript_5983/g.8461 Transcript_5983/m.8461 type:complete len:484 (+) Transcript_5983:344-1795(+)